MAIPLLALAAGGSALAGLGTVMGGFAQRSAFGAQALGAKIERDMAMLRGKQIGERSREDLQTALGNIDAIRSTRGASLDSQTGQMIQRRTMKDAYRDEGVQVLSELTRAGAAEQARKGYRTSAKWAVPLAVLNSGGHFAAAASFGQAAFRPSTGMRHSTGSTAPAPMRNAPMRAG